MVTKCTRFLDDNGQAHNTYDDAVSSNRTDVLHKLCCRVLGREPGHEGGNGRVMFQLPSYTIIKELLLNRDFVDSVVDILDGKYDE